MLKSKGKAVARAKNTLLSKLQQQLKINLLPILFILGGISVGWLAHGITSSSDHPKNLIWAIDKTVSIPSTLRQELTSQNTCDAYRGPGTPRGVALWGVQQISKDKFAKVVHGCSWGLDGYVMLVRNGDDWQLLDQKTYFAGGQGNAGRSALPACEVIAKYGIDQTIEPFCIDKHGKAKLNEIK